jgi:hypothetical protein
MVLFLLSLDYLDTPSNFASFPSIFKSSVFAQRSHRDSVSCSNAFFESQDRLNLYLNYDTRTQPFYNHCLRRFVQSRSSWDKLHSGKVKHRRRTKTKVYRKQDKNHRKSENKRQKTEKHRRSVYHHGPSLLCSKRFFVNSKDKDKLENMSPCSCPFLDGWVVCCRRTRRGSHGLSS